MKDKYPTTKEILYLLGAGALLASAIVMPGLGVALGAIERERKRSEWDKREKEWNKFNIYALRRNLKRLAQQKIVEIVEKNEDEIIKLTQKGHTKYLKFQLKKLSFESKRWDGKWRIVIYDIVKFKKNQRDAFRNVLRYVNFLKLQRSVYLTPYPCEEQIAYLREYLGIGNEVILIWANKIENEEIYKKYFDL